MTRLAFPVLALVAVLGTACTGTSATPEPVPTASPVAVPGDETPIPVETPTAAPIVASWAPDAPATELPDGWTIRDCEGDAPILCVDRDGTIAGTLMLDSFTLDAGLAAAADEGALVAALRANATARMQDLVDDRTRGCGDDYVATVDPVVDVAIGGLPGVRAGVRAEVGTAPAEHVVTYAAVAAGQLWILVAESAAEGSCMDDVEMNLFAPDDLDHFLPVLDRVVAGTPLPAVGTRVEEGTVLGLDGGLDGGLVLVFVGGELHRVQQPRAMELSDLEADGITVGAPVVHVGMAASPTEAWFAVVPPDGEEARLHLVIDGVAHPVVVQQVAERAVEGIPSAPTPALDRLTVA